MVHCKTKMTKRSSQFARGHTQASYGARSASTSRTRYSIKRNTNGTYTAEAKKREMVRSAAPRPTYFYQVANPKTQLFTAQSPNARAMSELFRGNALSKQQMEAMGVRFYNMTKEEKKQAKKAALRAATGGRG